MIWRALSLTVVALMATVMLYLSRFWPFELWSRPGLFGLRDLPPQGGLLGRWLRGTEFAAYEMLIWGVACFLVLTYTQKLFDLIAARVTAKED